MLFSSWFDHTACRRALERTRYLTQQHAGTSKKGAWQSTWGWADWRFEPFTRLLTFDMIKISQAHAALKARHSNEISCDGEYQPVWGKLKLKASGLSSLRMCIKQTNWVLSICLLYFTFLHKTAFLRTWRWNDDPLKSIVGSNRCNLPSFPSRSQLEPHKKLQQPWKRWYPKPREVRAILRVHNSIYMYRYIIIYRSNHFSTCHLHYT